MLKKIFDSNRSYSLAMTNVFYPQADRIKMHKKRFKLEVWAGTCYSSLNVAQTLININEKNPYGSVDEVMGDLHQLLVDSYKICKNDLNIKVPSIDVEKILETLDSLRGERNVQE